MHCDSTSKLAGFLINKQSIQPIGVLTLGKPWRIGYINVSIIISIFQLRSNQESLEPLSMLRARPGCLSHLIEPTEVRILEVVECEKVKESSYRECWGLARVNNVWNFDGAYWDLNLVGWAVVLHPGMGLMDKEGRKVLGVENLYKVVEMHRVLDY